MAYSVRDIAQQVIANLGLDWGYELAAQWVGQKYAELCSRAKFRHLRQYGQIYMPAPIQTGTCTVNLDSPIVTLDATALAACQANPFLGWPDGFSGLFFRPQMGRTWYRINYAEADGTLVLETPYAQDNGYLFGAGAPTVQTGLTLYIVPRYLKLDPNARQLGVFVCDFMYRPLDVMSEDELNVRAPNRFLVWAYPQIVAELNSDLDQTGIPKQVEIYPYPTESITCHYTYWSTPQILQYDSYLPPTIDPDIVRSGAMSDACANRAGAAVRAGKLEEAGYWTNLKNQYKTEFESKVNRAIRNDRGMEDLGFYLRRSGWKPPVDWDPIKGAFENFLARGV